MSPWIVVWLTACIIWLLIREYKLTKRLEDTEKTLADLRIMVARARKQTAALTRQ
jgi:hypothetical protein